MANGDRRSAPELGRIIAELRGGPPGDIYRDHFDADERAVAEGYAREYAEQVAPITQSSSGDLRAAWLVGFTVGAVAESRRRG